MLLETMGFTNLVNLTGGMLAWQWEKRAQLINNYIRTT